MTDPETTRRYLQGRGGRYQPCSFCAWLALIACALNSIAIIWLLTIVWELG